MQQYLECEANKNAPKKKWKFQVNFFRKSCLISNLFRKGQDTLATHKHTHTYSCTADTHSNTHPCPAARKQCFGKQVWMFAGLQSQTEQPLGLLLLDSACLHVTAAKENKKIK